MPAILDVTDEAEATLLRLPPRDLRSFAAVGACCIVVAAIFAGIQFAMVQRVAAGGPLLFDSFTIPLIVAIIGLAAIFISLLGSGTEFRIVNGELRITESVGPMRWTWGCRLATIKRLTIKHLFASSRKEHAPPPRPDDRAILYIECWGQPEIQCAHGHRRQHLFELAEQLARLSAGVTSVAEPLERKIPVVEEDEATLFEERREQPVASSVVYQEHPDGVTLHVPPSGIRRAGGLLFLSPGVLAIVGHFAIVFAMALPNPDLFDVISLLIGLVVLAGYVWAILARTRRQAVFAVVGDRLLLMETGVTGSKRWEWERLDLYDVRSGEGERNSRKTKSFELQLWKRDGKKTAYLKGRDEEELRWMATVLRRALRLPLKREELAAAPIQSSKRLERSFAEKAGTHS